ncbi:chromodomain-helicase-DNA-binding protein 1 isoform X1 [Anastrepha obliqua]|uniref:chromodomain-helicase-DNA-binding protein 1 isoform X1 n=1 Tax=Anastrepha obliqua TaxID=95512 RepID=UPI00240A8D5A|nr:chromodomain-helicase-DNA-binding protein 1 isoform X1 [Anastrepha obliqua]
MGRVHKKKIAEYAESAENENEQDEETKKGATVESNSDESDVEGVGEEDVEGKKKQSVVRDQTRPEGNTDDEFHSVQGSATDDEQEDGSSGTGGKKGNKRKVASEKLIDGNNDDLDSDDEPLNGGGGGGSSAKKGRKSAGVGKQKIAGKNGKVVGRRSKGKKAQAKTQAVSEEEEEGEEVYEVKDIVGHKVEQGVTYYLIRWKGYTKDDDTWEPEDTLSCPNIIDKYKNKQSPSKSNKKSGVAAKKARPAKGQLSTDPNKEWEVDKIIDYAEEKNQRIFRIRWKGFGAKHDTWEPEANLSCDEIIDKFMKRMKSQENVSFKELREEPKKTKRLVNETSPRTNYHNPIGRKSKRAVSKKRVYYGDSDE